MEIAHFLSCFLKDIDSIFNRLPNPILFVFLKVIDPIFNTRSPFHVFAIYWSHTAIFKNLWYGSSWLFGPNLFQHTLNFQALKFFQTQCFRKIIRAYFFNYLESFGVPRIKYDWFGESWSRPPGPKTMTMRVVGFS